MRWFGIETEYGIMIEDGDASDLVEASRAVVNAYRGIYAAPWNYAVENPRRDMRGFDAKALSRDPHDAQFDQPNAQVLSNRDDRVDHMLANGARLYNDHGHPEYATPECADIFDLVAHDKAGERIVWQCAQQHAEACGKNVQIVKNNVDYHGASYGCHESYLMARAVDWENALPTLAAFLATRIIFTGAGKVGGAKSTFQLSQRADHIDTLQSVDTLYRRPLVNTRDEPHADAAQFRRLHVISGDANMSEFATALKMGTMQLVVALLERGWRLTFALRDPVQAIKAISQDPSYQWNVETTAGRKSALDIQQLFLDAASALNGDDETWILAQWRSILCDLRSDPLSCHDRLDWAAKKVLLDDFVAAQSLDWHRDQKFLQSLDIAYADLNPEHGLYHGLVEEGHMRTLVTEKQIQRAMTNPPQNTRAALRGWLVNQFHEQISAISWDTIQWPSAAGTRQLSLKSTFDGAIDDNLKAARSLEDVAHILRNG